MIRNSDLHTTSEHPGWLEIPHSQPFSDPETAVVDAQAIREVIGLAASRYVLPHVFVAREDKVVPNSHLVMGYREYARIHQAIRELYGHASHGILNRIGRITFRHFVGEQADQMAAISIALRLMPLRSRKVFVLRVVARVLSDINHQRDVSLMDTQGRLKVVDSNSPACIGVSADSPICWHTVGFIEEALRWATARDFKVEEIACGAQGAPACTFAVAREPGVAISLP